MGSSRRQDGQGERGRDRDEAPPGVYADGSSDVVFTVSISDPNHLDGFANTLSQHFEQAGWRPRSHQESNPRLATSFSSGWQNAAGGIAEPNGPTAVYQWLGEWEDQAGDVIHYHLLASYYSEHRGDEVRGDGAYVPVQIVKAALSRERSKPDR